MMKRILPCVAAAAAISLFFVLPAQAQTVPFLSQAPFGEWSEARQGQGCEEAVSLMAVAWAKGQTAIDKQWGRAQVIAMSDWEKKKYGYFVDTSIQDTADRLIKEYLGFSGFSVEKDITVKNVAAQVFAGNVVIVPIDGRQIGRPYYAHGGPRHHVLIVFGYDRETDTFIFHDPGKTKGFDRTITGKVLQKAMRDYPSGNGRSRLSSPPSMIVFPKS
jgi:hypothetical protein